MIVFLELFLLSIYKITNLNYVENIYEKKKRYNFYDPFLDLKKKKYELKNIEKKKIAIFGGSTANGFGVNISFYQILKKILEKEAIVHSYARNEAAFVQDQSLILDLVIHEYDQIIIYSGHNEMYPFLYNDFINNKNQVTFPDQRIFPSIHYYGYRNYYLEIANYFFNKKKNIFSINYIKFKWLNNSRIFCILDKLFFLISDNKKIPNTEKNYKVKISSKDKYNSYSSKQIFTKEKKKKMTKNFIDKINLTAKKNPDKSFIISTVLSNYFYPPFSDYSNSDANKNELKNNKLVKWYSGLLIQNKILDFREDNSSSNYNLISSIICSKIKKLHLNECIKNAIASVELDNIPFRVLPSLNDEIKKINHHNIKIIDPVFFLDSSKTYNDFNSYFIDFQHITEKGHFLIAKEILKDLKPSIEMEFKKKECRNIEIFVDNNVVEIADTKNNKVLIKENIVFLSNFKKYSLLEKYIDHFINNIKKKYLLCYN